VANSPDRKLNPTSPETNWKALGLFTIATLSLLVSSCEPISASPTPAEPPPQRPTATLELKETPEEIFPEPTVSSTAIEVFPTPTSEFWESDRDIEYLVETARDGKELVLENVLVGYVAKVPRFYFPAMVFATLEVEKEDGQIQRIAFFENADCIFDELRETRELGDMIETGIEPVVSGLWRPKTRTNIEATVYTEAAFGLPIVLTVNSIEHQGVKEVCVKDSALEKGGEWFRDRTQWLAGKVGEVIDFIEEKISGD
jgi:hypothetical protein